MRSATWAAHALCRAATESAVARHPVCAGLFLQAHRCSLIALQAPTCPASCAAAAWPGHNQVAEHHDAFVRGEPLPVEDDATWLVQVRLRGGRGLE